VINAALQNAREALGRRMAETSSQARLMDGLRDVLGIGYPLRRIEIYDNSHIMGTNAVGGMVVAGTTGFAKNQYRKFNIKWDETKPGDDFAMMREVLTRRFSRLVKDEGLPDRDTDTAEDERGDIPAWPDLLLIDGGAGQLSAVRSVLEELGVADAVALVGVAKGVDRDAGRERIFMQGRDPFTLPPRDPVLYFIQRLRDEAHRFAIGTHRAKRKKELVANPLDEIEGIGPTRKRALLQHFGTAKAVSRAGLEDLAKVEGVSKAMAQAIHDHFR
jgi:excinuclease ABC subunit C